MADTEKEEPVDEKQQVEEMEVHDGENRTKKMGIMAAWKQWPKTIFFIVGNEFCERFNYYGMKAVLFLYLLKLGFDDDGATTMYHLFSVLCYFSPILGAILADGYLGKFHVIVWLSLLYASGSIILAVASMLIPLHFHPWLDLVGLFVIGVGTGGIKPCVAPFGADQFVKGQEALIEPYFSFFYAAINCGSLISTIISPIMQVLFLFGSLFGYRKIPPKENIFAEVFKAIWRALKNKRSFEIKREHWLDHYMDNHSCENDDRCTPQKCHKLQFIDDVKQLFRILIMYLPIPFFWTLFDQQGSRWLIQTVEMNYDLGGWTMPPSLVQAINPILILAFIPLFQGVIYPLIRKCGINPSPLRRMVVGGLLAALAFIVAGAVQIYVDYTLPVYPVKGTGQVNFFNILPCNVTVTNGDNTYTVITNGTLADVPNNFLINQPAGPQVWQVAPVGSECANIAVPGTVTVDVTTTTIALAVIAEQSLQPVDAGVDTSYVGTLQKDQEGLGLFTFTFYDYRQSVLGPETNGEGMLILCSDGRKETPPAICDPHDSYNFQYIYYDNENRAGNDVSGWLNQNTYRASIFEANFRNSTTGTLLPGVWWVYEYNGTEYNPQFNDEKWTTAYMMQNVKPLNVNFTVWGQGSVWAFALWEDETQAAQLTAYRAVSENTVSVLWQVPQFAIITAAEICMSITGLEFSYSQSAQSMKSVVQAAWLLTSAVGDTIIIIIADSNFMPNLADEMFFFAGLMVGVTMIFMLLAIFYYEYRFYDQTGQDEDEAEIRSRVTTARSRVGTDLKAAGDLKI